MQFSAAGRYAESASQVVSCEWNAIREQIIAQWGRVTRKELEDTRHDRRRIARLIEQKYGVHCQLVENYLKNLERTLPLMQ